MKYIKLTKGKKTKVDDEDYTKLSKWKWCSMQTRNDNYYAIRSGYPHKNSILLHRYLLNLGEDEICDHINGDTLDNRKENLRVCNRSENARNRALNKNTTSGYKGVTKARGRNRWTAQIRYMNQRIYIGTYSTAKEASMEYKHVAKQLFGKFYREV